MKFGSKLYKIPFEKTENVVLGVNEPKEKVNPLLFIEDLQMAFSDINLDLKNILVVVSDKTRLCGYDTYLPVLEKFLVESNVKGIDFIIAYGSHKKQSDKESISTYGEIYRRASFIHPDSNDIFQYLEIGQTKRGTPVRVRKEVLETDIVITFGAISHHYFAGYGGGRKLLFPGLAHKESVYANHSLFLDKENKCLNRRCMPGVLEGNPLSDDLQEIDEMMPAKVSIHGILNSRGVLCDLQFTKTYHEFVELCRLYDGFYKKDVTERFDMVIASCGGYPKDINFIQSHKGIHHASFLVKDGGDLIVFAECRDGIGSDTFLPYMEMGHKRAFEKLAVSYEGNGGTALSMMEKTKRINIWLVTALNEDICHTLGVNKIDVKGAKEKVSGFQGKMAVIENASMLVPGLNIANA